MEVARLAAATATAAAADEEEEEDEGAGAEARVAVETVGTGLPARDPPALLGALAVTDIHIIYSTRSTRNVNPRYMLYFTGVC